MGKRGIRNVINDSWEAGSQNWTDNMLAQFKALRGYDATPWLPVLTGRVVESAEASDRFLWASGQITRNSLKYAPPPPPAIACFTASSTAARSAGWMQAMAPPYGTWSPDGTPNRLRQRSSQNTSPVWKR